LFFEAGILGLFDASAAPATLSPMSNDVNSFDMSVEQK
jgi:hypothetical protein